MPFHLYLGGGVALINQSEIDILIDMPKTLIQYKKEKMQKLRVIPIPPTREKCLLEAIADNKKDFFLFDISNGGIRLSKKKFQKRHKPYPIPLIRIDIDGPPHDNPDGEKLSGTHIHIFQAGWDDKWAYPIEKFLPEINPKSASFEDVLFAFLKFCNIKNINEIEVQASCLN